MKGLEDTATCDLRRVAVSGSEAWTIWGKVVGKDERFSDGVHPMSDGLLKPSLGFAGAEQCCF